MNVRSLFSGAGGLDLGLERAGLHITAQCEIDPWRRRVLAAHWPDTPCDHDVRQINAAAWPARLGPGRRALGAGPDGAAVHQPLSGPAGPDLLCGGFPCQDLSVAGRRTGLNGTRSSLFFQYARITAELRPRWLLVENVPGLLSSADGRDFAVVLSTLADLGYGIAWRVLDARYFGVPQRRRRVFIVGRAGGDPEPALRALGASGKGDPATGPCSWQRTPRRTRGRIANALTKQFAGGGSDARESESFLVTHSLTSEGHDASEDGTGRGTPLVVSALQAPNGRGWRVDAEGAAGGHLIAAPLTRGSATGPGVNQPGRRQEDDVNLVAFHITQDPISGPNVPALGRKRTGQGVHDDGVRRLTPVECERLMSWPDNWTAVDGPKTPDSRRYAACGDGVVSNVAEWIGRRVLAVDRENHQ